MNVKMALSLFSYGWRLFGPAGGLMALSILLFRQRFLCVSRDREQGFQRIVSNDFRGS
jgi:hypothetical protein